MNIIFTKEDAKKRNELINDILGLKLGLFHITNGVSYKEIDDAIKEIENDDDRIVDYIYQGLDSSNAQKRFKNVKLADSAKNKMPHEKMNEYLTEAFWCYVTGMFKACVALCRTSIEIGIRDQVSESTKLKYKEKNYHGLIKEDEKHLKEGNRRNNRTLAQLINWDLKSLCKRKGCPENKTKRLLKLANFIKRRGNIIIHSNKDTADKEEETRNILMGTREFLGDIYNL